MKKITSLLSIIFLLASNYSLKAQDNLKEAAEYMDQVTKKAFELEEETWNYLKAVTKGKKASKVEDKRNELVRAIKTAKLATARRKDFNGDGQFRDAVVNYLDLRYTVMKEDYDKILNMEEIAEQSYDAMEAYLLAQEKAGEKLDSAFVIMSDAQVVFAEKYGVKLLDDRNKRREKIIKAAETLEYYNEVYLIFFKSYKQEAYVLDAIERNDVSSIEQNTASLKSTVEEGQKKLRAVKPYKGDGSMITVTRKILTFYQSEANKEFASLADYFLKKDEFEKLNKKMEGMSKKERTQEFIDQYNKAVKEFNEANDSYNNSMQNSYKTRSIMLEEWNNSANKFISKHS